MTIFLFLVALVVGGIASWQIFNWMYASKLRDNRDQIRQEATVLLERIEKVCKVVVAEGYFSEIYDHNSQQEFLLFWNTHKKALIVTRAKVSVGFDFAKIKTRRSDTSRKMIIEQMPPAEVISIAPTRALARARLTVQSTPRTSQSSWFISSSHRPPPLVNTMRGILAPACSRLSWRSTRAV